MDTVQVHDSSPRRSVAGLVSDLWRDTTTLLRQEAELAKAELSEKISQVQTGVGALAIGGAIVFAGFLVLLSAAVAGLAQVLPPDIAPWLAPLIIGVVVLIVGFIAVAKGRKELKTSNLAPNRAAESLRRDAQLAREHLK
jgi:drug/metabolite transporter (DMT)-like permease